VSSLSNTLRRLEDENEALRLEVGELVHRHDENLERIATLEGRIDELKAEVDDLRQGEQLQGLLDDLSSQCVALIEALDDAVGIQYLRYTPLRCRIEEIAAAAGVHRPWR
jgi:chromosome segregation ATPase